MTNMTNIETAVATDVVSIRDQIENFAIRSLTARSVSERTLRAKIFAHFGAANVTEKEVDKAMYHLKQTKQVETSGTKREFLDIANRGKTSTSVDVTSYIVRRGSVLEATVRKHVTDLRAAAGLEVNARSVNATLRGILRGNKFERVEVRKDSNGEPVYKIQVKGLVEKGAIEKADFLNTPVVAPVANLPMVIVAPAEQVAA